MAGAELGEGNGGRRGEEMGDRKALLGGWEVGANLIERPTVNSILIRSMLLPLRPFLLPLLVALLVDLVALLRRRLFGCRRFLLGDARDTGPLFAFLYLPPPSSEKQGKGGWRGWKE